MVVPELNCCALDSFRLFTVSSPQIEEDPFKGSVTAAATDPYPIVVFVVCLLAAMSMTDDRIAFTNRTSA
jgi:hypothetical protein